MPGNPAPYLGTRPLHHTHTHTHTHRQTPTRTVGFIRFTLHSGIRTNEIVRESTLTEMAHPDEAP